MKKLLTGVGAAAAGLFLCAQLASADTLPVYDISEWQSQKTEQQFKNVKSEVSGLIIRQQYGSNYIDKYAAYNTTMADKVGIPYGQYAYARFVSADDARQEAKDFYNRSDKNAKFYVLDFEENTVKYGTTQAAVQAWLDEMKSLTNKHVVFYSYRNFADFYVGQSLINKFDGYWLAAYQGAWPNPRNYDMWQNKDNQSSVAFATSLDSSLVDTNRKSVSWWFGSEAKTQNKKLNSDSRKQGFNVGQTVILKQSATKWYQPRVNIASYAKGQTYTIKDTQDLVLSKSNQAVLLYKGNVPMGWALAQDVQLTSSSTANQTSKTYTVKFGDSWWAIANRYGISMYTLASLNGNSIYSTIYPGQILKVSGSATTSSKVYYTVRKGDTVSKIASEYSVSVSQIKNLSGLKNVNYIWAGQSLRVK
ncbi:MAG: LysM peptidoglycan-binding domain-containing protein [Liquorilactobacillus nagelii]|jgi:LysM repeat protein/GH25 family lysozyme M1 (1,4-beta-N-acetylmuramidase)|uniref:LysM peptidoglycan-binding domain-containing protein n=1 Tax=Liquorilactobacillus nagelii TaxID=82688 RepID=UPI0024316C6C|nr:LysM peptidoglycan-binding domain-containing protein [Liquorilactobacillus nagelii]MCI1634581.1 LysM peptidoglycan-binding domain-containing protein [Liquorilactobacillus nagelii]